MTEFRLKSGNLYERGYPGTCAVNSYSKARYSKHGMAGTKDIVDNLIKNKKVVVFSKSYCPYCSKAKKEFEKLLSAVSCPASTTRLLRWDTETTATTYKTTFGQ